MALKGTIGNNKTTTGRLITGKGSIQAKSMTYTPQGTLKMQELTDVDVSQRDEGSLIIWDDTTQTFKVKSEIKNDNTYIVGGTF